MGSHADSFCIKSVRSAISVDASITPTENFDFGEALSGVYPILGLIFDYLPYRDLTVCLDVCESWQNQAKHTLSQRRDVSWFTCYKRGIKRRKSNFIAHSNNINYNNAEVALVFYNCYKIRMNKYVCVHHNVAELTRVTVPEYLEDQLVPPKVDYCLLSVPKVASRFDNRRTIDDTEFFGSIFEGVVIPKIPSMRTVMFICSPNQKKDVQETINAHVRPNEEAKCLLLFCKTQLYECLYNILECVVPKDSPNSMALGGGVIRGTKTFQKIDRVNRVYTAKDTVCILFLKDTTVPKDNFHAYSAVIRGVGLSKQEFDATLNHMKSRLTLKRHSLGFRICCSSKYQDSELESFTEIFPGIPLVGLEAYGEIGWDCYPNASSEEDTDSKSHRPKRLKRLLDFPNAENEYSTVFVLITWD